LYCELPGKRIDADSLALHKSHDLANFLRDGIHPYARFVAANRYADGSEAVVFEVDPELPQVKKYEIWGTERLATIFWTGDNHMPETLALRDDFPPVEHINPTESEFPRSLCIYEENYAELRLLWTPAKHIERIRLWLRENARGELHKEGQPLEQIFVHPVPPLILPSDVGRGGPDLPLSVAYRFRPNGTSIFVARREQFGNHPPAFPVLLTAPTRTNSRVRTIPSDFLKLHLLAEIYIALLGRLFLFSLIWRRPRLNGSRAHAFDRVNKRWDFSADCRSVGRVKDTRIVKADSVLRVC
jgi:hypothetical protein